MIERNGICFCNSGMPHYHDSTEVQAERERCARIAEEIRDEVPPDQRGSFSSRWVAATRIAERIRQQPEKGQEPVEKRYCVKCGRRMEPADAAHVYTCEGKGNPVNPAPFID